MQEDREENFTSCSTQNKRLSLTEAPPAAGRGTGRRDKRFFCFTSTPLVHSQRPRDGRSFKLAYRLSTLGAKKTKQKQPFNLSDVQSNRRGTCTTLRNNEAFIYCMLRWVGGGKGGRSLMPPNNTPVYSLLGLPSLNTFLTFQELHSIQKKKKSAERDLRRLFSPQRGRETHNDLLRATWDLVKGNNGRIVLASLGSNCCIDAVVLENHCIQWRNSCSECF